MNDILYSPEFVTDTSNTIGCITGSSSSVTIHVLVFRGNGEIQDVRAFPSKSEAMACRHQYVTENWMDWLGNEPMPDDPDEAYNDFDMAFEADGTCVYYTELKIGRFW